MNAPGWRYFTEEGTEIVPKDKLGKLTPEEKLSIVYQVNTRIRPRAEMPTMRESGGQVAQITVQVARNPNLTELPMHTNESRPEYNLIKATKIPVFTYSGLIGKNQGQ